MDDKQPFSNVVSFSKDDEFHDEVRKDAIESLQNTSKFLLLYYDEELDGFNWVYSAPGISSIELVGLLELLKDKCKEYNGL